MTTPREDIAPAPVEAEPPADLDAAIAEADITATEQAEAQVDTAPPEGVAPSTPPAAVAPGTAPATPPPEPVTATPPVPNEVEQLRTQIAQYEKTLAQQRQTEEWQRTVAYANQEAP